MNRILPLALMVALGTSGMALADDDCPSPMANWQSREAASTHVQGLGIRPDRLKIDDGCYEVRGRDGDDNRVQLKLDPATLALIELDVRFRPGADTVRAFLRRNPGFHAGGDTAPLILVGAGTGIGPLAGFIRANARNRPVQMFFGLRHPDNDFLYRDELTGWQAEGRLTRLSTAIYRGARPHYVQEALCIEADAWATALMVSGAREDARG